MKKRNRSGKTLLTLLLACLLIFMAGCGGEKLSDDGTQPSAAGQSGAPSGAEDTMKIGFVTAAGGVGDESLTDMVYGGIVDAVDEIGAEFNYVEPQTSADFLPMFKEFAQDGTYDVIIGVGYECAEPIAELAPAFPDQHFLAIDTTVEGDFDNVACIVFNRAEQGYIVGLPVAVLANADSITVNGEEIALDDSNNTIGSIIGTDAQTIVESQIGLYAACKYVDPSINILTGVVGTWTDSAKATEIALSMYSQGANIIWQNAGNGGKGIFSAAADMGGYSCGWNTDQTTMDPDHILFSVVKSMGKVAGQWLIDYNESGEFVGGVSSYGYATGGYELVYSPNFEPSQEMLDIVEQGLAQLKSGEIVIPLTWDELDAFDASYK